MRDLDKTLFIEANFKVNGRGVPRGSIYGVGVNDADFCTQPTISGKIAICPAYDAWQGMLRRCYSSKLHAKRPTYVGVTACKDWHSFINFREWWISNQVDGWHLDKDILSDDGVYSPETCIYVPQWLNSFINENALVRGCYPIGASFHKRVGKFSSNCSNPSTGRREHVGYFDTPENAHKAWRTRKLEIALELKPQMDGIDLRIYPRVVEIIRRSK